MRNQFRKRLTARQARLRAERRAALLLIAFCLVGFAGMFYGAWQHDCRHHVTYTGCK